MKKGIANQQLHPSVSPRGKCKIFPQINTANIIANEILKITEKKATGNCKEKDVIYAAQCFKHKVLFIGYTRKKIHSVSPSILLKSIKSQTIEE